MIREGVGGAAENVEVSSMRAAGRERPFMSTNVVSSCNLQNADYYYQLSVASTASAVSEVAVLHRCYAGVFASIVNVCSAHD